MEPDRVFGRPFPKTRTEPWDGAKWDDGFIAGHGTRARFKVYRPDFPRSSDSGWALRALVVWWLRTGNVPEQKRVIHHVNEDKLDDRFENLQYVTHSEHQRIHRANDVECVCIVCGQRFVLPQWRITQGKGRFCSLACYHAHPRSEQSKERQSKAMKIAYDEGRHRRDWGSDRWNR